MSPQCLNTGDKAIESSALQSAYHQYLSFEL